MSLGVRLKQARLKKKLTQEELAEIVGIKQQAVQRIEAGKVKSTSYVVQIARALDVTPEWLALGEEATPDDCAQAVNENNDNNAPTPGPSPAYKAALLNWNDVELIEQLPLQHHQREHLPIFNRMHNKCFALQVKDNSMASPNGNELSFLKDDYIIADASQNAKNGDFVVAKFPDSTQLSFRQLKEENGVRKLAALNPQYNSVDVNKEIKLCGVVFLRFTQLPG